MQMQMTECKCKIQNSNKVCLFISEVMYVGFPTKFFFADNQLGRLLMRRVADWELMRTCIFRHLVFYL